VWHWARGWWHRWVVMTAHGSVRVISAAMFCMGWSQSNSLIFSMNITIYKLRTLWEILWLLPRRLSRLFSQMTFCSSCLAICSMWVGDSDCTLQQWPIATEVCYCQWSQDTDWKGHCKNPHMFPVIYAFFSKESLHSLVRCGLFCTCIHSSQSVVFFAFLYKLYYLCFFTYNLFYMNVNVMTLLFVLLLTAWVIYSSLSSLERDSNGMFLFVTISIIFH